ncbi:MAG: exodeoxyribonuclease V subunit gamma [Actinomycetota bacterium]|nr:exodeoxyribonuclease V subunit gamma [Actinomycetota bacterium]
MLVIHRAERADCLAEALGTLLAAPLPDPFADEIVAVPTRGMERWLTQRLSGALGAGAGRADGICAGVRFPFPQRLLGDVVASASGIDPDGDPWLPDRAAWPLLEVISEALPEPWLSTLARYLGREDGQTDPVRADRRLGAARHLAELFHRYALHRPSMIEAWRQNRDEDALGAPLPVGAVWQAELWRRLRARIDLPGPAERRRRAGERLQAEPQIVDLPNRMALFGLTRLPAGHLEVLRALALGRDVHLFLLHPSAGLWDAIAADLGPRRPPARRSQDRTAAAAAHPLLASWGRDARELQLVLAGAGSDDGNADGEPVAAGDEHHRSGPTAPGLLGRLQDGIRADRPVPGSPLPGRPDRRARLDAGDHSVQIHSCHGRARQVEVIRDAVLHALAQDDVLEPRDVIVMCPDVESFAPLIEAVFGAGEPADRGYGTDSDGAGRAGGDLGPGEARVDLRVRLADRSLRQTNPILGVVTELLDLAHQRLTASQVLDLADREPVRRRFRLDDDDLTRLQDWVVQAGIRWGLDAAARAPYKLQGIPNGTWDAGLERLLLGVTMTEDGNRLYENVLPLDDVDSQSIDLAGRLAELIARLRTGLEALSCTQPLSRWSEAIAAAADTLTSSAPRERWQRAELQRILDELVFEAGDGAEVELAPAEVRSLLAARLQGRPTRANFRTGHLTVCTLMPMRSVPHRVVCLLGLDDGAFPRKAPRDGDDLMLDAPQVGERDPRSEDRQLLLDALLAATERLIITYTGNDERTNTARPPAVPVGELLDAIDATVRLDPTPERPLRAAREQVLIRHPLQPFDPRNFTPGELGCATAWSFDPVTLAGARALAGSRSGPTPFLFAPLPARPAAVIELEDLVRFVEHPVKAFLRQRLGISLRGGADEIADGLPVELDGLGRWGVGQRLLEARLDGVDGRDAALAEIARGLLPPVALGAPVIRGVFPIVEAIVDAVELIAPGGGAGEPVDVRVDLPDGRRLSGTVAGVAGDVLLITTYSRVAAKHRLAAWVRLLALLAAHPDRKLTAATVGRGQKRDDVRTAVVGLIGDTAQQRRALAMTQLAALIDLRDRGLREPLPLFCQTSAAYAQAAHGGQDAELAGRRAWESEWNFDHEDRELEHQLVLGGELPFTRLLQLAPQAGEDGPDWRHDELTRFGRLARRLWDGLLACEQVSAR